MSPVTTYVVPSRAIAAEVAAARYGQRLDLPAVVGFGPIVAGVVPVNGLSRSVPS
jgi:hypothetical protein